MKLEGSLDAFSLPDVFQLLSLTKKSGGLHLTNGQASGVVYFTDGAITGAVADQSKQGLARRVIGLGAADDAALRRAVDRCASESAGIGRALLEAGAVDASVLQRLALEEAVDAAFDLLRWPNGDFAFAMGEENPDDVGLAVSAEQVVTEATARRDSWESLSRLIPSPDVVLTMPVVLPEDAAAIAPDEWALLSLVDGQRSVGVLVDVSGAGQFTVVSTLASLLQRGLVVLRDEETPDHVDVVRRRQQLLGPLEGATAVAAEPAAPPAPEPQQEPAPEPAPEASVPQPAAPVVEPGYVASSTGQPSTGQPSTGQPSTGQPSTAQPAPVAQPAAAVTPAEAPQPTVEPPLPTPAMEGAVEGVAPGLLPGAHAPAGVVPPRPEPFLPRREVEHPEPHRAPTFAAPGTVGGGAAPQSAPGTVSGTSGVATAAAPASAAAIERDPTVNRSLMLRLIAGVRGL